jgi:hypothetical protein
VFAPKMLATPQIRKNGKNETDTPIRMSLNNDPLLSFRAHIFMTFPHAGIEYHLRLTEAGQPFGSLITGISSFSKDIELLCDASLGQQPHPHTIMDFIILTSIAPIRQPDCRISKTKSTVSPRNSLCPRNFQIKASGQLKPVFFYYKAGILCKQVICE